MTTMPGRTLLLVDDEENILSSLVRLLRRDGYQIFRADSGKAGLELLAQHPIGVIVSDQRMPEMNGVEFLSKAKEMCPDTVRIVLSGYTDLQSVTDAINRGAVYRFLTKPWEDDLLRANIEEAFRHYEMAWENERLGRELKAANDALLAANLELGDEAEQQSREAVRNLGILRVSQEVLEHLPLAVVGVDPNGVIALSNRAANRMFNSRDDVSLAGEEASGKLFPELLAAMDNATGGKPANGVRLSGGDARYWCHSMGAASSSQGVVLVVSPQ